MQRTAYWKRRNLRRVSRRVWRPVVRDEPSSPANVTSTEVVVYRPAQPETRVVVYQQPETALSIYASRRLTRSIVSHTHQEATPEPVVVGPPTGPPDGGSGPPPSVSPRAAPAAPSVPAVNPETSFDLGPPPPMPSGLLVSFKRLLKRCFGNADYDWSERLEVERRKAFRTEFARPAYGQQIDVVNGTPVMETQEEAVCRVVRECNKDEVRHVPALVVHVVVELRMKLGLDAADRRIPGNVSLVRRETARILRGMNVRNMDAAAHLEMIEQCFFEDDTHFRVTRWRARAAAQGVFTRWLYNGSDSLPNYDW